MPELVTTYTDLQAFADDALPFFLQDEAAHNLQLGITNHMLRHPKTRPVFLATLRSEAGAVIGAATLNHGHHLVLSGGSSGTYQELCRIIDAHSVNLKGVFGPSQTSKAFAEAWCTAHSLRTRTVTRMALLVLRNLLPPRTPAGSSACATREHLLLLVDWTRQFHEELHLSAPPPSPDVLRHHIDSRNVFLWVLPSHGPVSSATVGRESSRGLTVTSAYTPAAFRGQGFASACVASACRSAFERGKQFCVLYADLDNPTSTGLYERLGFERLSDSNDIAFER